MSNLPSSFERTYLATPIGDQMSVHLARRTAIRHATPLLPRSWAELLAPWRKAEPCGERTGARENRDRQGRLSSQSK